MNSKFQKNKMRAFEDAETFFEGILFQSIIWDQSAVSFYYMPSLHLLLLLRWLLRNEGKHFESLKGSSIFLSDIDYEQMPYREITYEIWDMVSELKLATYLCNPYTERYMFNHPILQKANS